MEFIQIEELACCAVSEISQLSEAPNAKAVIRDVAEIYFGEGDTSAFYIFTDIQTSKRGGNLAAFITKHELGAITKTNCAKNPNTGNKVTVWVWQVDAEKLKPFFIEEKDPEWV